MPPDTEDCQLSLPLQVQAPMPDLPAADAVAGRLRRVVLGGQLCHFRLRRARRRTIGFQIDDQGLTVSAPKWVSLRAIEEAILEKERWIRSKLAQWQDWRARHGAHRLHWADGAVVHFLGEELTLKLRAADGSAAVRVGRELQLALPAGASEAAAERVAPAAVDLADLGGIFGRLAERHGGRDLDRLECPIVEVGLQLCERADDIGSAEHEADAPAGHRERLGQAVELDGARGGPVSLQDRGRLVSVEGHVGVREVVDEQELALAGEVDEPLHVERGRRGRRRVVREGHDHHARAGCPDGFLDCIDRTLDRRRDDRRSSESRRDPMDRVARRRDDRDVTGLEHHPHQVGEPFLSADRAHDFRVRIERNAEPPRIVLGQRATQLLDAAARRVTMVGRLQGRFAQLLDGDRGRRNVGVSETEVDHVATGVSQLTLQLVDGREDVRGQIVDTVKLHFQKYCTSVGSTEQAGRGLDGC